MMLHKSRDSQTICESEGANKCIGDERNMCYSRPVFSVIIPTYNREKLLKRAIDSILNQTYKHFELIIVDDGSTDHTKDLVESYKDNRIIYIYKENGGQNSALNKGIECAKGEYIAFCDSDDSWFPGKLKKHIAKYSSDEEIKVVYDLTGIIVNDKLILARNDTCDGWCYKEVLEQGYLTSPTFLTCKKECFEKIGLLPEDLVYGQDDDLCFKLCKHYKIGLVKEILGILHSDADNRVTSEVKTCAEDYFKLWNNYSIEVIDNCGLEVLKKKYMKAAYNFACIGESDKAKEVIEIFQNRYTEDIIETLRLRIRERIDNSPKIILYGTGEVAKKLYKLLVFYELDLEYIVVATKLHSRNNSFFGMEVKEMKSCSAGQYLDLPVIVASNKYFDDMKKYAENMGFSKIISGTDIIDLMF